LVDHNILNVKINGHQLMALVDTGASKSCISPAVVKRLKIQPRELSPGELQYLTAANGLKVNILGHLELSVNIKGLNILYVFLFIENLPHELLLGVDFLQIAHARIDLTTNTISFGDDLVIAQLCQQKETSNVLKTTTRVTIPPQSEAMLPMTISDSFKLQLSMIEPLPSVIDRKLIVAKSVTEPSSRITNCLVLNPTNASKTIKKGTALATLSAISIMAICDTIPTSTEKGQLSLA
jgi:predicted aspartyl protease